MKPTFSLGKVHGIPIGMHWSAIVLVLVFTQAYAYSILPALVPDRHRWVYLVTGLTMALLIMASVLFHELAHSLLAVKLGQGVDNIVLWALGGVSYLKSEAKKPSHAFWVAFVGPLSSVFLGVVFAGLAYLARALHVDRMILAALITLAIINVFLAAFNMIPAVPFDGGAVLSSLIWWVTKKPVLAKRVSAMAGLLVGGLMLFWGFISVFRGNWNGLWYLLLGWFVYTSAKSESRYTVDHAHLGDLMVNDVMTTDLKTVPAWMTVESFLALPMARQQRLFPVVDFEVRPVGIATLKDIASVDPVLRATTRMDDLRSAHAPFLEVIAELPLVELVGSWLSLDKSVALVVDEHGVLIGTVSNQNIEYALERRKLQGLDTEGSAD